MIYIDTSVVLADLFVGARRLAPDFWERSLVTSRLTEYETWTRVHSRDLAASHGDRARHLLGSCQMMELSPIILDRVLDPFPVPLRTLDALHVATVVYLHGRGERVSLATFDRRMTEAARAMDIPFWEE